jgi:hypothetical protein
VAIPSIKERMHFTDGSLGLSLLLGPLGALTGVFLKYKNIQQSFRAQMDGMGLYILCSINDTPGQMQLNRVMFMDLFILFWYYRIFKWSYQLTQR